jgi:hypothetical protein
MLSIPEIHQRADRIKAELLALENEGGSLGEKAQKLIRYRRAEINDILTLVLVPKESLIRAASERMEFLEANPLSAGRHDVHMEADLAKAAQAPQAPAEQARP